MSLRDALGEIYQQLKYRHIGPQGNRVVAVELNAQRALGAWRLTRLVRLHDRVRVVRGDALEASAATQQVLGLGRAAFPSLTTKSNWSRPA